jgi:hypothetical protein
MTSATWTTRLNGQVYLQISVSENAFSGSNQSSVNYSLDLICDSGGHFNNFNNAWYVSIGGTTWASGNSTYNLSNGQSKNLASGTTGLFTHDNNGVLSVGVTGYYDENANSCGGTLTLTDFYRGPTAPSSVVPTVNTDKTISVAINGVSSPAGAATYYSAYSMDGGAYTGLQASASSTIVFSGLTPGHNYNFSGYASNSDGTGGTTYSSPSVFLPSGGKRFDGTSFVSTTTAKRFDGTSWQVITTAKRFDGTNWVNLS